MKYTIIGEPTSICRKIMEIAKVYEGRVPVLKTGTECITAGIHTPQEMSYVGITSRNPDWGQIDHEFICRSEGELGGVFRDKVPEKDIAIMGDIVVFLNRNRINSKYFFPESSSACGYEKRLEQVGL